MKQIFREIFEHIKEDFNIFSYAYVIVFTFGFLALSYSYNLMENIILIDSGTNIGIFKTVLFYLVVYIFILIPVLSFKKKLKKLKSIEFWIKTIIFISAYAFCLGFYQLNEVALDITNNRYEAVYLSSIFTNLKILPPILVVLFIIKIIFDKKMKHLYGLRLDGLDYKPYFLMLLIMLPIIIIASFSHGFISYYPLFKYWEFPEMFGLSKAMLAILFEFSYALSFIPTELLFRGALVIGLAKFLGRDSVIAMASLYCFAHFGKPFGETVSSFFGGYILGVIALNHKNINGGILLHIGIALMMDTASILQYIFRN